MISKNSTLEDLQEQFQRHSTALDRLVDEIANELRVPPPRGGGVALSMNRVRSIDALVVKFTPLLPQYSRTHADAARTQTDPDTRFTRASLHNKFDFVRSSIHQWYLVRNLVTDQLKEPRFPLVRRRTARLSARDIHERIADDLFNALQLATTRRQQDNNAESRGAFPDIGLHNSVFTELMLATYRLRLAMDGNTTRFLDVGCGAGVKVMGAARFFHHVAGLEIDPGYLKVAKELLHRSDLGRADLIEGDALTFADYSRYNVIYFFRPLRDDDRLLALEQQIVANAKPGTILLAPYVGFTHRHRDYGCQQIARNIFLTGTTRKDARQLKRRAEFHGLAVQPPTDPLPGVWQPILEVSHANGFDLYRPGRLDGV